MLNSIGSSASYPAEMRVEMAPQKSGHTAASQIIVKDTPPPQGKGLFADLDTDARGGISQSEFNILAEGISNVTGSAVDVKNTFGSYDKDGNGVLISGEELRDTMTGLRIEPPPPPGSMAKNTSVQQRLEPDGKTPNDQSNSSAEATNQTQTGVGQNEFGGKYRAYHELMIYLSPKRENTESIDVVA